VHAPPKPAPHASQRPAQTTHITPQPPVKAAVPQRQGHQQPAAKPVRQVHQKPAAKPVRQVHQQPAAKPVRQVHQQPAAKALPQRPLVPVRAAPMAHKKR
jgi:hypothetical protein